MNEPKSIHALADEYVLGLLTPQEEAELEARAQTEPALQKAIAQSRDRFVELDLATPPVAAPEAMWSAIEAKLQDPRATSPSSDTLHGSSSKAAPANDNVQRWRFTALASVAASVALALSLGWSLFNRPDPLVVAVILNDQGTPVALVEDFDGPAARVVALADFDPPAGRAFELWTLPNGAAQPVSIGVWAAGRTAVVRAESETPALEGQLYAISLEQAGGSPTGLPTGPILGKGFAAAPR